MHKRIPIVLAALASWLVPLTTRANDIEPGKEFYTVVYAPKPIVLDGDLAEWSGVPVLADPKFAVPWGSGAAGNYVLFEEFDGGSWSGPDDQTSAVQIVYDADNVYFGFVVTDDYHENMSGNAWNGDSKKQFPISRTQRPQAAGPWPDAVGPGNARRRTPKPEKKCLPPPEKGGKSPKMNPMEKQFSLNRAASKKQFPISNNKGASVRLVRLDETIEAFAVREALESLAVRAATPGLKGRCEKLRQSAGAIEEASRRKDFAAFQEHNQVFHRAIVEAAGNRILLKIWDSLFFQVRTRWTMDYLQTFDPVAIAREHIPIVDALESGEPELAASLLASHSNHIVEFLKTEAARRGAAATPVKALTPAPRRISQSAKPFPRNNP